MTRRGELVHVGQKDVEGESKSHNKDEENYQHFDESIQDIMENGDVFSNPRKLPLQEGLTRRKEKKTFTWDVAGDLPRLQPSGPLTLAILKNTKKEEQCFVNKTKYL